MASARAPARRAPRIRSSARRRAVVRSQAPGRWGMPVVGQRSSAWAKASCTTSSAVSMSRTRRSTEATTRAYSMRKMSAICSRTPTWYCGLHLPDRPHLHHAAVADRHLLRPLERLFARGALDQVEAAERLLRLREGTVGHHGMTRLHPHPAGLRLGTKPLADDGLAGPAQLLAEPHESLQARLALGARRRGRGLGLVSDQ